MESMEHKLPSAIQNLSAQVSANGASVNAQSAVPSVGKSPDVQYPSGDNYLFVRGFPRKMIGIYLVKEFGACVKPLQLPTPNRAKLSIWPNLPRSGWLVSRQEMV